MINNNTQFSILGFYTQPTIHVEFFEPGFYSFSRNDFSGFFMLSKIIVFFLNPSSPFSQRARADSSLHLESNDRFVGSKNCRVRVTMQAKTEEGKVLYHRSTTKAEGEQTDIYRALGLSSSILRTYKTVI